MAFSVFSAGPSTARASELKGAAWAIEAISAALKSNGAESADPGGQGVERLKADLTEFKAKSGGLPADQAAKEWMGLWDRFFGLSRAVLAEEQASLFNGSGSPAENLTIQALVSAIPGPEAWEHLAAAADARIAGRPALGDWILSALSELLDKGPGAADRRIDQLLEKLKETDPAGYDRVSGSLRYSRPQLNQLLPPEEAVEAFAALLEAGGDPRPGQSIEVPDLVALAGEERAAALLSRALTTLPMELSVKGDATLALAKKLTLERIQSITVPQWGLVTSIDDIALYEALEGRFGKNAPGRAELKALQQFGLDGEGDPYDTTMLVPRQLYLVGLMTGGRTDDAVELVLKDKRLQRIDYRFWWKHMTPGMDKRLVELCERVIERSPGFPMYDVYLGASFATGQTDRLLERLEAKLESRELGPTTRLQLLTCKANTLLALENVDGAVALLTDIDRQLRDGSLRDVAGEIDERFSIPARMYQLGKALGNDTVAAEAVALIRAAQTPEPFRENYRLDGFIDLLIEHGDLSAAEELVLVDLAPPQLLLARLPLQLRELAAVEHLNGKLLKLANIYSRAGRHEDVLLLLEKAPWWGTRDLAELLSIRCDADLGVAAAGALHGVGRDGEALAILKHHLLMNPRDDRGYELLLVMGGIDHLKILDELYARDRFEERPLIWKAVFLLKQGKAEEAEAAARAALKVDPTDGETKKGDRARAYAVLSDILKARGKAEDATFFGRVIQAVRIAERGDELADAGLLKRSRDLYIQAEDEFADAYCVQWRLGERLYALGDYEGAREHYKIAFERMPEQFGQVASFCFGCEGVFTRGETRSIAETVFTHLSETMPDRPQVDFMLGQLRKAQGRFKEALGHYRKAVKKDPGYLDAWREINQLKGNLLIFPEESDAVLLRLVELDPTLRHGRPDLSGMSDMRLFWSAARKASATAVPPPENLLKLTASARLIEVSSAPEGGGPVDLTGFFGSGPTEMAGSPGEMLLQHSGVLTILGIYASGMGPY